MLIIALFLLVVNSFLIFFYPFWEEIIKKWAVRLQRTAPNPNLSAAAAEKYKESNYDDPNRTVIVKKIAEAVIHIQVPPYIVGKVFAFPLPFYAGVSKMFFF